MKFLHGGEHKNWSIIPQRLYSCWELFLFSTGDGVNRERRLFATDSFSDHPQLADSADPPLPLPPAPACHKPPSLFHLGIAGVSLPPPLLLLLLLLPPLQLSLPFGGEPGQLIDDPCRHLVSTRPPPARDHGENMSRVAARTRPGSILSVWIPETDHQVAIYIS